MTGFKYNFYSEHRASVILTIWQVDRLLVKVEKLQ